MRITFYGGAQEVGRMCMLLEDANSTRNVMFDCGIKLGEKTEYPLIHDDELRRVRNITISHAHMDHTGYLPHVYAKGAKPKIFMTKPTRDLVGVLLADYYRIHHGEREQRKLFSMKDVDGVMKDSQMKEFNEEFISDFKMRFLPSGHILGSAVTLIEEKGGIAFSGDICMRKTRLLDPCYKDLHANTLMVESTYGGKEDSIPSYKESYQKLIKIINETLDQGGHVIIPSFAVGRAQEILLALDDYMKSGLLRPSRIFIEGMIGKAMKIHRHNAYYANDELKKRILMSEDDPFNSKNFYHSRSKTREDVMKEPSIIVTTSGMLSGGPVLFYLQRLGNDPKNTIVFVGYQAEGTLGRKVASGEKKIMINEQEIELKMRVEQVRISGHADFNELLQFINSVKGLKKVFLVHGEKTDLKDAIEKKYEVIVPRLLETYSI